MTKPKKTRVQGTYELPHEGNTISTGPPRRRSSCRRSPRSRARGRDPHRLPAPSPRRPHRPLDDRARHRAEGGRRVTTRVDIFDGALDATAPCGEREARRRRDRPRSRLGEAPRARSHRAPSVTHREEGARAPRRARRGRLLRCRRRRVRRAGGVRHGAGSVQPFLRPSIDATKQALRSAPSSSRWMRPDAEGAVREWLRNHSLLTVVGRRVFFGLPEDVTYPCLTVSRIGGAPEGVIDNARLSVHSWGSTKNSAADAAKRVVAAVEGLGTEVIATGVLAHGGTVNGSLWSPASPDDFPRYVVDATILFYYQRRGRVREGEKPMSGNPTQVRVGPASSTSPPSARPNPMTLRPRGIRHGPSSATPPRVTPSLPRVVRSCRGRRRGPTPCRTR